MRPLDRDELAAHHMVEDQLQGRVENADDGHLFTLRLEAILARQPAERREEQRVRELRQADVRFGVLDSDKSGRITPAEFAFSGWSMFIHHDTNKDGFVTKDDAPVKDGE